MGDNDKPFGRYKSFKKSGAGEFRPIEVLVEGDNVERAIRILKRKMADEGVFRELKKRRYYEKPSEKKKRKHREAIRRQRKALRKRH